VFCGHFSALSDSLPEQAFQTKKLNVQTALMQGTKLLEDARISAPRLTAEVLLAYALKQERAYLYGHPDHELSEVEWLHYGRYLHQRLEGHVKLADAIANGRSPVVDPAEQPELHVHVVQHERAGTHEYQKTTDTLHVYPLVVCSCYRRNETVRPQAS